MNVTITIDIKDVDNRWLIAMAIWAKVANAAIEAHDSDTGMAINLPDVPDDVDLDNAAQLIEGN